MDALEVASLRWAVGDQPSHELPDLATDALLRGRDSPSLRALAGTSPDDSWQIRALFESALEEMEIAVLAEQDALWLLARHICGQIVAGEQEPFLGATQLWREISHRIEREGDLRIFIGLASEREAHPALGSQLDASVTVPSWPLLGCSPP